MVIYVFWGIVDLKRLILKIFSLWRIEFDVNNDIVYFRLDFLNKLEWVGIYYFMNVSFKDKYLSDFYGDKYYEKDYYYCL